MRSFANKVTRVMSAAVTPGRAAVVGAASVVSSGVTYLIYGNADTNKKTELLRMALMQPASPMTEFEAKVTATGSLQDYVEGWQSLSLYQLNEMLKTPEMYAASIVNIHRFITAQHVICLADMKHASDWSNRVTPETRASLAALEQVLTKILDAYVKYHVKSHQDVMKLLSCMPSQKEVQKINEAIVSKIYDNKYYPRASDVELLDKGLQYRVVSVLLKSQQAQLWKSITTYQDVLIFLENNPLIAYDVKNLILCDTPSLKYFVSLATNYNDLMKLFKLGSPDAQQQMILMMISKEDQSHAIEIIKKADLNLAQLTDLLQKVMSIMYMVDSHNNAQKGFLMALGDHPYIDMILANMEKLRAEHVLQTPSVFYLFRKKHGDKVSLEAMPVDQPEDTAKPNVYSTKRDPRLTRSKYAYTVDNFIGKHSAYDHLLSDLRKVTNMTELENVWKGFSKEDLTKMLATPAQCAELIYIVDDIAAAWYRQAYETIYTSNISPFGLFGRAVSSYNKAASDAHNIPNKNKAESTRGLILNDILDLYVRNLLLSENDLQQLILPLANKQYQTHGVDWMLDPHTLQYHIMQQLKNRVDGKEKVLVSQFEAKCPIQPLVESSKSAVRRMA